MAIDTIFRRDATTSAPRSHDESDEIATSGLQHTGGGTGGLWTDAFTTGITVGGGAAYTGTTIGKAGTTDTFSGDVQIDGNLTVSGTTTTIDTELQTADAHILLNSEYTADAALANGIVMNVDPDGTSFSITDITTNVITTAGDHVAAGYAVGDFILIQNPANPANAGVFEIGAVTATTITIDTTPVEGFSGTALTDDATAQGTMVKVQLAVLRSTGAGVFQTGTGTSAPITYSNLATGAGNNLQGAYEQGNTIVTDAGNGDFDVSGTEAISLDASAASNFTVAGAGVDLTLSSTAGRVILDGGEAVADAVTIDASAAAGGIDMDSGTAGTAIDSTGAISLDSTATASNFNVSGNDAGTVTLTLGVTNAGAGAGLIDMDSDGAIEIDAGTGVSIDAGAASNLSTSAGDLTVDAAAASLILTGGEAAADAVRIQADNAAGGIDVDAGTGGIAVDTTGALSLDSTGTAANLTLTANDAGAATLVVAATNSGAGAGNLDVDADDAITIDAGAGVSIDGGAASNFTTSAGDITIDSQAGSVNVDGGEADAAAVSIQASNAAGGVDMDAGTGGIAVDTTGPLSLDSTGTAANLTLTANDAGTATLTIASSNAGAGTGVIDVDANDAITVDSASAGISLDAATASNLTVSGATEDLTLGARGNTITLNEADFTVGGETIEGQTLAAGFTATSIIGAINELAQGTGEASLTTGEILVLGDLVYLSAASTVSKADASADDALSRPIGFAEAAAGAAAAVKVIYSGLATAVVDAATYAIGEEIYMSETAGRVTNTPPATASSVRQKVGIANEAGVKTAGQTLSIWVQFGTRTIN